MRIINVEIKARCGNQEKIREGNIENIKIHLDLGVHNNDLISESYSDLIMMR